MTTTIEDMALAELRVKLFGAAQMLKGDGLEELKKLVKDVSNVLDVELDRPAAKMAKALERKAEIEHVQRDLVSHAQNPSVLRRARDFYAVYCASSDGKNYQGLPCPAWDNLTDAVRGHWYTVALRSLQLEATEPDGSAKAAASVASLGNEKAHLPNDYTLGHLSDPAHALDVWREYSGQA